MGTHMLENILRAKFTVLVFTVLQTDIGTRVLGMNEEDKVVVCIILETETLWDNKVLTISTSQDTSQAGSSSTTISHAKLLKAVREARLIAEKEEVVADMDERVNRAVTAANRAANVARVAAVKAVQNRMHDVIDDRPLEIV